MRIKMLQTVEDSHKYVKTDAKGDPSIAYDVRKFAGGETYDDTNGGPDFERRAAGLIAMGLAEQVD